jgi:hypothetical protein
MRAPKSPARLQAEQTLADDFEVGQVCLHLLAHGVHVAEAAFERIALEDRRRAGGVIDGVDDLAREVAGVAGGRAHD